jgi:hypothetical protein
MEAGPLHVTAVRVRVARGVLALARLTRTDPLQFINAQRCADEPTNSVLERCPVVAAFRFQEAFVYKRIDLCFVTDASAQQRWGRVFLWNWCSSSG